MKGNSESADPGVATWFASVPADKLFLSVPVVGQIRQGIERLARRDPDQAEIYENWLSQLEMGRPVMLLTSDPDDLTKLTGEPGRPKAQRIAVVHV
jgi:hypothetical protein